MTDSLQLYIASLSTKTLRENTLYLYFPILGLEGSVLSDWHKGFDLRWQRSLSPCQCLSQPNPPSCLLLWEKLKITSTTEHTAFSHDQLHQHSRETDPQSTLQPTRMQFYFDVGDCKTKSVWRITDWHQTETQILSSYQFNYLGCTKAVSHTTALFRRQQWHCKCVKLSRGDMTLFVISLNQECNSNKSGWWSTGNAKPKLLPQTPFYWGPSLLCIREYVKFSMFCLCLLKSYVYNKLNCELGVKQPYWTTLLILHMKQLLILLIQGRHL